MANVTKIKFQYFKPLEKGTTEHTGGGPRRTPAAPAPALGDAAARPGGGGAPVTGVGGGEGAGPGGRRAPPPRPAATPGLLSRPAPERSARPTPAARTPGPRCPPEAAGCGIPEIPPPLLGHRDPTRRQRLPRERPSAPGARGKSPSAPMSERLPHDGHARGRGFPSPLPSSGNPL